MELTILLTFNKQQLQWWNLYLRFDLCGKQFSGSWELHYLMESLWMKVTGIYLACFTMKAEMRLQLWIRNCICKIEAWRTREEDNSRFAEPQPFITPKMIYLSMKLCKELKSHNSTSHTVLFLNQVKGICNKMLSECNFMERTVLFLRSYLWSPDIRRLFKYYVWRHLYLLK